MMKQLILRSNKNTIRKSLYHRPSTAPQDLQCGEVCEFPNYEKVEH